MIKAKKIKSIFLQTGEMVKIGDSVKILNPGNHYDNFFHMFKEFGFKNQEHKRKLIKGEEFKITGFKPHPNFEDEMLVSLTNNDREEFIVGFDGIENGTGRIENNEMALRGKILNLGIPFSEMLGLWNSISAVRNDDLKEVMGSHPEHNRGKIRKNKESNLKSWKI